MQLVWYNLFSAQLIFMPRINSNNFYQNRPKIVIFPKKKLERWGTRLHASGGWVFAPRLQLPPVVGGSAPRPPQRPPPPPHCRFFGYGPA